MCNLLASPMTIFALIIQLLKLNGASYMHNGKLKRKEIRELSDVTLSVLQAEFNDIQKELASNSTLFDAVALVTMEEERIIKKFQKKIKGDLPFWDYQMDIRLKNPKESSILLMKFCQDGSGKVTINNSSSLNSLDGKFNTSNAILKQLNEIEHNCKNGALLTLLKTFVANHTVDDQCSQCQTEKAQKWLFCDESLRQCVSKIAPNGNCERFSNNSECCFQSICLQGRCKAEDMKIAAVSDEKHAIVEINDSSTRNLINSAKFSVQKPESANFLSNYTLYVNSSNTFTSVGSVSEGITSDAVIVDSSIQSLKSGGNHTNSHGSHTLKEIERKTEKEENFETKTIPLIPPAKHFNLNKKKIRKKFLNRRKGEFAQVIKVTAQYPQNVSVIQSKNSTVLKKKFSRFALYQKKQRKKKIQDDLSEGSASLIGYNSSLPNSNYSHSSFQTTQEFESKLKFSAKRKKILGKKQRKAIDDSLFHQIMLPTAKVTTLASQYVYFSITVIEGNLKRYSSLNRAPANCNIMLVGANMPYGFTEKINGRLSQQSSTSAVLRTLNPDLFGPLVEFNVTVNGTNGRPCQQKCMNNKGMYESCEHHTIRLSSRKFSKFSDPIKFYSSQKSLLENQWTGRGYYRKKKRDFLLFVCDDHKIAQCKLFTFTNIGIPV
ncbi:unnamed protein product [Thelazia callipaeda]|uniref:Uncharacterized protein n=1 Tax=Thelazia callipaeda TaxID=103827 RepID=A0A0N5D9I2_THECL|nr:unnamed protein product [Thelazia callipaeda]